MAREDYVLDFHGSNPDQVQEWLKEQKDQKTIISDMGKLERIAAKCDRIILPLSEVHSFSFGDVYEIGEKCFIITLRAGGQIAGLKGLNFDDLKNRLAARDEMVLMNRNLNVAMHFDKFVETELRSITHTTLKEVGLKLADSLETYMPLFPSGVLNAIRRAVQS